MKKYLSIILLIVVILMISLPVYAENEFNNIKAKVIENNGVEEIQQENLPTKKVQNVIVRILEGEYENEEYEMVYVISEDIENTISNVELEEDDNILVEVQEQEGEITNVTYKETINSNYTLYIALAVFIVLILIISQGHAIKSMLIFLVTIVLAGYIFILGMQNAWNLILVSSILSLVITMVILIKVNGINTSTIVVILCSILATLTAGTIMYLIFDGINLTNINIKITQNFVNIRELLCSLAILFSCGISNAISVITLNIYNSLNKPYKTKSDNIIEGQRSLKL